MVSLVSDDVRRVVTLLGSLAANSRIDDRARKSHLLHGLAELLHADIYVWAHVRLDDDGHHSPYAVLDGGWASPEQRIRFLEICQSTSAHPIELELERRMGSSKCGFYPVAELVPAGDLLVPRCRASGIETGMLGAYRVTDRLRTTMAFHRLVEPEAPPRPPMGQREIDLATLVLGEIEALHITSTESTVTDRLEGLTERERTVLLLLMGGESRKQVARQLGLSEYTVADYIQSLYRHFRVSSRAELMSLFLAGRTYTPSPD